MKTRIYSYYDRPDTNESALGTFEPTRTQQQYAAECDINTIMKGYTQDGLVPPGTTQTAVYGDFTTTDDYLTALLTIENARLQFEELPARVRARFNNNPVDFLSLKATPLSIAKDA